MKYSHLEIETKWQKVWDDKEVFKVEIKKEIPKYYVLDMFPYPSSQGLHVGHPEGYTATDIISRYKRCKGFNVLHPMGWDAFGLPAEQYAIQTGIHPEITTEQSISNFKKQLKALGFSFDWSREISTCDPRFYKWTQFIFEKLYEKGLAYQKEAPVNWCPALKTVLANEEVVDGKSERGGHPVERVFMKQWMLKITSYAERLLEGLDKIDWPTRTKEAQKNWIGKSEGASVCFPIVGLNEYLSVFTTRPDTLFGATFMVVAPEHPLLDQLKTREQENNVDSYVRVAKAKSERDRQMLTEKTGVFTGAYAVNPMNEKKLPIWVADYVLMGYGTGAIMAVPAHDERDFEFANKFNIPIQRVIEGGELPFVNEGLMVNSEFLNGLSSSEALTKSIEYLEGKNLGERKIHYKLRDWLFSRQRYWGEPFPIIHYPNGDIKLVDSQELPVLLPEVKDFEPSDRGESPLARNKEWLNAPAGEGVRETDTMPGSAGSSWYFLRYTDPHNDKEPFSFSTQQYWMPVDLYIGGPEHTVGHLLYSRFWQKVLFDVGLVSHDEPFQKLVHQGMILGKDNEKMSKSRGNIINPDDIVQKYGADALRVYEMFMGPLEKDKPWQDSGIEGVKRFLDRVWRLCFDEDLGGVQDKEPTPEIQKLLHKTIQKVSSDIETFDFNTAISQMMIFTNALYKANERPRKTLMILTQLLMPFAPHLAEELWEGLGGEGLVSLGPWPQYDPALVKEEKVTLAVQVNGKMRGTLNIPVDATEDFVLQEAKELKRVQQAIGQQSIFKTIYKPGKVFSILVK